MSRILILTGAAISVSQVLTDNPWMLALFVGVAIAIWGIIQEIGVE